MHILYILEFITNSYKIFGFTNSCEFVFNLFNMLLFGMLIFAIVYTLAICLEQEKNCLALIREISHMFVVEQLEVTPTLLISVFRKETVVGKNDCL